MKINCLSKKTLSASSRLKSKFLKTISPLPKPKTPPNSKNSKLKLHNSKSNLPKSNQILLAHKMQLNPIKKPSNNKSTTISHKSKLLTPSSSLSKNNEINSCHLKTNNLKTSSSKSRSLKRKSTHLPIKPTSRMTKISRKDKNSSKKRHSLKENSKTTSCSFKPSESRLRKLRRKTRS